MSSSQTQAGEKAQSRQQADQRPQHHSPQATRAHTIHRTDPDGESDESDSLPLLWVGDKARQPIVVKLTIDGQSIPMEVNTGAAVSMISLVTNCKKQLFPHNELLDTTLVLTTYTG